MPVCVLCFSRSSNLSRRRKKKSTHKRPLSSLVYHPSSILSLVWCRVCVSFASLFWLKGGLLPCFACRAPAGRWVSARASAQAWSSKVRELQHGRFIHPGPCVRLEDVVCYLCVLLFCRSLTSQLLVVGLVCTIHYVVIILCPLSILLFFFKFVLCFIKISPGGVFCAYCIFFPSHVIFSVVYFVSACLVIYVVLHYMQQVYTKDHRRLGFCVTRLSRDQFFLSSCVTGVDFCRENWLNTMVAYIYQFSIPPPGLRMIDRYTFDRTE